MPLRSGFDYPLPKTSYNIIKGGTSGFVGNEPRGEKVFKSMLVPGPGRYNGGDAQIKATMPNVKGATQWNYCGPRFADPKSQKVDKRDYNPDVPSTRPKWNFGAKGGGHKVAMLRTCGADAFYDVKKDYVDCATVGGMLVQGAVQGLGSRAKKVADLKLRNSSVARVLNYPKRPGPGHYENKKDVVLPKCPSYSQTKMHLDKARFPGTAVLSKMWVPPPGQYKDDEVIKKRKVGVGARLEQQLGRNSSYTFGSS